MPAVPPVFGPSTGAELSSHPASETKSPTTTHRTMGVRLTDFFAMADPPVYDNVPEDNVGAFLGGTFTFVFAN